MTACPDEATLRQFLGGGLGADANQVIDAHVSSCPHCQRQLEEAVRLPDAWRALLAVTDGHREVAEMPTTPNCRTGARPPLAGPDVPGYELVEEVGRGGMGVVYRARDLRLRREVAVKVLAGQLVGEPHARQRFLEEAHIAAQLQHPGIAAVHELGELADRPFLAMKLVKGETLADRLRRRANPQENLPALLQVFEQVCQAVAYAHSHGVIHRDLKPANIMAGAFGEVQVMDWGLAKVLPEGERAADEEAVPSRTVIDTPRESDPTWQTHGALGTWAYMAPEQARGQVERVDARSDVFGLGAILCEVLTGQPPYVGTDRDGVRRQAEDADLAAARSRLDGCGADPALVALARACLAARPEDRPADAGVVADAVAAYQAQVQDRLRRAELARAEAEVRVSEGRRRQRLYLALATVGVAALALASGGAWLWQAHQVEQRARRAEEQARLAEQRGDVSAALARAAEFCARAHWEDARLALKHAEERLGEDGPADLRAALVQRKADRKLAKELDDIRLRKATVVEGKFQNIAVANREYEEAFRNARLGSPDEDIKVVAARVRASAIRSHLLAALDDWAARTWDEKRLAWLLGVARLADDPGNARFRDPEVWMKLPALRRVAEEAVGADLSPALFTAMIQRLRDRTTVPRRLLQAAVTRHPTDFWAHFRLANALREEAPKEAVGFYWAALALRPQIAAVHNNLGATLRDVGDINGAIAAFRQAIASDPRDAAAHHNLGLILHATGDVQGAIAAYRQAIASNPRDARAYTSLGLALQDAGDLKGASAAHRQAIACNPRFALAHYNLGVALSAAKDVKGAITAWRAAIAHDPRDAQAHTNLGNALYASGDPNGASAAYRRAIACNPRLAGAYWNLGHILQKEGEFAAALVHLKRGHELGSGQPGWRFPSAEWVSRCERLIALEQTLTAVLEGKRTPANTAELLALADLCAHYKKRPATAARYYADAFAERPGLADDVRFPHRYSAARAAARAAAGAGIDAGALDEVERLGFRAQAYFWLRADLAAWTGTLARGTPQARLAAARTLAHWLKDADLASVREPEALIEMHLEDAVAWCELWADVVKCQRRAQGGK